MKYYIAIQNTKSGPFSIEDLKEMKLKSNTLIWYEGLADWTLLDDLKDLKKNLEIEIAPPPLPSEKKKPIAEGSEQINLILKNEIIESKWTLTKNESIFLSSWIVFHLLALTTSYVKISKVFTSNVGKHKSNEFWPFVEYIYEYTTEKSNFRQIMDSYGGTAPAAEVMDYHDGFHGIFYQYDITEFIFYISIFLIYYIFGRLIKK
ncbi:MAG: DUF4339 domain-containing protein [Flavobacteriales bacterium]